MITPAVVAVALVVPRLQARSQRSQVDPDSATLVQLRKAGSDLSKPHETVFYLYLPSETPARRVADELTKQGFQTVVRPAATGTDWLCKATKRMLLTYAALAGLRRDFIKLLAPLHGEYDGWEAKVVK